MEWGFECNMVEESYRLPVALVPLGSFGLLHEPQLAVVPNAVRLDSAPLLWDRNKRCLQLDGVNQYSSLRNTGMSRVCGRGRRYEERGNE